MIIPVWAYYPYLTLEFLFASYLMYTMDCDLIIIIVEYGIWSIQIMKSNYS